MSINRYNQGFGGFGPLEQCKDGKLVKYNDVIGIIDAYKNRVWQLNNLIDEVNNYTNNLENSVKRLHETSLKDMKRAYRNSLIAWASCFVSAILAIRLLAMYWVIT